MIRLVSTEGRQVRSAVVCLACGRRWPHCCSEPCADPRPAVGRLTEPERHPARCTCARCHYRSDDPFDRAPADWQATTTICRVCGLSGTHGCRCRRPDLVRIDAAGAEDTALVEDRSAWFARMHRELTRRTS